MGLFDVFRKKVSDIDLNEKELYGHDLDLLGKVIVTTHVAEEDAKKIEKTVEDQEKLFQDLLTQDGKLVVNTEDDLENTIYNGVMVEISMLNFINTGQKRLLKLNNEIKRIEKAQKQVEARIATLLESLETIKKQINKDNKAEMQKPLQAMKESFEQIKETIKKLHSETANALKPTQQLLQVFDQYYRVIENKKDATNKLTDIMNSTQAGLIQKIRDKEKNFEKLIDDLGKQIMQAQTKQQEMEATINKLQQISQQA